MSADMPDAGASRKRQIQIAPRLFGRRRRFARIPYEWPMFPYRAFRCIFPGSAVSTRKPPGNWHGRALREIPREFSPCACLTRAATKSREIDSMSPAGRFDSRPRHGSRASRACAGGGIALYRCIPHPGNLGLSLSFAGFCPRWALRRR